MRGIAVVSGIFGCVTTNALELEATPARKPIPLLGLWVFLACVAIAFVGNLTGFGGTDLIFTDNTLLGDNQLLNRLAGLQSIWFKGLAPDTYPLPIYSPLTQTFFFFERMIWGDHWWGYRIVSILLHAGVGWMLWQLLRRLNIPGALAIATLFVAHPITVESVCFLTERRNPLAALLALSSAFLMLRASNVIPPSDAKTKFLPDDPKRLWAMGIALFIVGLFAHAAIAPLPLVVLLVVWWRNKPLEKNLTAAAVGLSVVGLLMLSWTASIEQKRAGMLSPAGWNRADTAAGEFAVRSQIAGRAVVFYAAKLALPHPLAFDYARWQTPKDVEAYRAQVNDPERAARRVADVAPDNVVAYAYPLIVVAALVGTWMLRPRFGKGPFVAVASFVLLLLPALGFIDLGWMRYSFVANRAAYLAAMPFVGVVVILGMRLLALAGDRIIAMTTQVIVAAALVLLSLVASLKYRSAPYFWFRNANAVVTSSGSADQRIWLPRVEMTLALMRAGEELDVAHQAIDQAIRSTPQEPRPLHAAGLLWMSERKGVEAMQAFETCMTRFPTFAPAYYDAGRLFSAQADAAPTDPKPRELALRCFLTATENDPLDAWSRVRLGQTLFEIARRIDPSDTKQIDALADRAAQAFDEAVQLRPYDPQLLYQSAKTLVAMGRLSDAGGLLRTAQAIAPDRADIVMLVADAAMAGKYVDEAEASLQVALTLDPTLVEAYVELGQLRQAQDRFGESIEMFEKALKFDPTNADAIKHLAEVKARAATQPTR